MGFNINLGVWEGIGINRQEKERLIEEQLELLKWTWIDLGFIRDILEQELERNLELLNKFFGSKINDHCIIERFHYICERLLRSIISIFDYLNYNVKVRDEKIGQMIKRADENVMLLGPLFADTPFEQYWEKWKSIT